MALIERRFTRMFVATGTAFHYCRTILHTSRASLAYKQDTYMLLVRQSCALVSCMLLAVEASKISPCHDLWHSEIPLVSKCHFISGASGSQMSTSALICLGSNMELSY